MSLALSVVLLLSQAPTDFTRSRVKAAPKDEAYAHCLWWRENSNIEFRQNIQGNDATPGDSEFDATRKAFSNWQKIFDRCASLNFTEGALTANRMVGHNPASQSNENVVVYRKRLCSSFVGSADSCWRDEDCANKYDCWQYNRATIGLTTTTYLPETGEILGADIELNSVSFTLTTVDSPVCVAPFLSQSCVATDVENTMTHEIGHLLGLAHSGNALSTMSASAPVGELAKRQIDPGSEAFVCRVYQKGAFSEDCVLSTPPAELGKVPPQGCSTVPMEPIFLAVGMLRWVKRKRLP